MTYDALAITRKIRAAGRADAASAGATMGLLTAFHEREPFNGVRIERDIAYGPDERNRFDLFSASAFKGSDARDILIFLPGGGFVGGDKRVPGSPYHDNIALWAVRHGMIGINMNYRLAPKHKWPSVIEDIAGAVGWARKHVREHGGSPERVFLYGASAGAVHAASYVTHSQLVGGGPVAGAILQSGKYDYTLATTGEGINERAVNYFGSDQSTLAERSSLNGLIETKTPILYVLVEFEIPEMERAHTLLIDTHQKRRGEWPNLFRLMGHNHFTATPSLNTPDNSLGNAMLAFIDSVPRS